MDTKFIYFFSFLILLLGVRFLLFSINTPKLINGQKLTFTATILDEPKTTGNKVQFSVMYGNIFSQQKISVSTNTNQDLAYGQVVRISSAQVKRVIIKNHVSFTLNSPKIEAVSVGQNSVLALVNVVRQKVKDQYFFSLPTNEANLLFGIVFGVKGDFSQIFLQDLQSAGVLHVIAASGMNITLVAAVLFGLVNNFFKRQVALGATLFGICFYAVLAGLQPSILRATIMTAFAFTGQILGRQYSGLYGLFLAAVVLLLINPALLFDVGFQLSAFATLGILLIKPLFPKVSFLEDLSTTVAAQLATLPILLTTFGTYGLLSVLVNFLVLWTIPPLMVLGGVGALLSFIFSPLAHLMLLLCIPLLWFFESVVGFFGGVGWNIQLTEIPFMVTVGYYAIVGSIVILIKQRSLLLTNKNI